MAAPLIQYATTSDGVSIAYYDIGEGLPFVWVSAYPGHFAGTWDYGSNPQQRQDFLDMGLRLIGYDGRAMGSSDRHVIDFSIEAQVRDLEAVVDHLALKTFVLVGSGAGTYAAVSYGVQHPNRISHFVLLAPIGNGRIAYETMPVGKGLESLRAMGDEHWDTYMRASASIAVGHRDSKRSEELALARLEGATPEATRAWYATLPELDVLDLLPRLTPPTLVLVADNIVAPAHLQRAVAARIPAARSITFKATYPSVSLARSEAGPALAEFLGLAAPQIKEQQAPQPAPAPKGLVTILFTDLASSTALTQRLGDVKLHEVRRAHNTIVRDALATHGGTEIKHTGDGIMASFGSASGALECAIAVQRGVAERDDPNLGVHIGLNAGEPIVDERDLFGTSVDLARRVCDQASGGEILVSDVVRQLAAGKDFLFSDHGVADLKGFDEPVRLFEVRWREGG